MIQAEIGEALPKRDERNFIAILSFLRLCALQFSAIRAVFSAVSAVCTVSAIFSTISTIYYENRNQNSTKRH